MSRDRWLRSETASAIPSFKVQPAVLRRVALSDAHLRSVNADIKRGVPIPQLSINGELAASRIRVPFPLRLARSLRERRLSLMVNVAQPKLFSLSSLKCLNRPVGIYLNPAGGSVCMLTSRRGRIHARTRPARKLDIGTAFA
jgi:hypothetical protein